MIIISRTPAIRPLLVAAALAVTLCPAANAAIVVLEVDLPLDKVAAGREGMKVGDHHRARIFYDQSSINPKTHIVPVIHMEHMMGGWVPTVVGDPTMPMRDAWLDLGSKPYRYHYKAPAVIGEAVVVEFNEHTRRMTISKRSDNSLIMSAPYSIDPSPVQGVSLRVVTAPAMTMLNMQVTLSQVAARQRGKVGDIDRVRLIFDANAMDPRSKRVKLANMQHFIGGKWFPAAADPVMMPTSDSWLDTSTLPYRLHFKAYVVHGLPIIIDADENARTLTIRPQSDPTAVLESGNYEIDPTPSVGPEALAAGSAATAPML